MIFFRGEPKGREREGDKRRPGVTRTEQRAGSRRRRSCQQQSPLPTAAASCELRAASAREQDLRVGDGGGADGVVEEEGRLQGAEGLGRRLRPPPRRAQDRSVSFSISPRPSLVTRCRCLCLEILIESYVGVSDPVGLLILFHFWGVRIGFLSCFIVGERDG